MSTTTLELSTSEKHDTASWAAVAFIASYSSEATRRTYTTQLRLWMTWCSSHHLDPLADIRRPHIELYARELEARGLAAATIALKLVVLTGFYRYCVEEQLLEHSPAAHVRRPKVSQTSTRLGLDRNELGAFLVQAGLSGGNDHVLARLLGLNALRVSEACGADLGDLAVANGHRTLRIIGKGAQLALIPLAPRTARAIDAAVGERTNGPLLTRPGGRRLDRHADGLIAGMQALRGTFFRPNILFLRRGGEASESMADMKALSDRLGHSTIAFTLDKYAEALPKHDRKLATDVARLWHGSESVDEVRRRREQGRPQDGPSL